MQCSKQINNWSKQVLPTSAKSTIVTIVLLSLVGGAQFNYCNAEAIAAPATQSSTQPSNPTSNQPSTQPTAESLKMLSDVAAKPAMLLTHDASSAMEKFTFSIVINPPANSSSQATTVLVVRDGNKMGVVVGAKKYPSYYMTNGLFIGMDQKNPGGLIVHEGGSMQVVFGGADAGKKSKLNYTANKGQDIISLDPAGMLKSIAANIDSTDYRPTMQRMTLKTKDGNRITIKFPRTDAASIYPIESLLFQPAESGGFTFAFGNVQPHVALKKSIANRTLDDARKLGVPIRMLKDDEVDKEYIALVRADFGEKEEEIMAVEKLQGFFPEDLVEKE